MPGKQRDSAGSSSWKWTIGVASVLSSIVALAGVWLSRVETRIPEKPPGNLVDDAFRLTVRRIREMEGLWEKALDDECRRVLDHGSLPLPAGHSVAGVTQWSILKTNLADPARAHFRRDGGTPAWRPVLERHARGDEREWVMPEAEILHGSGWIETRGKPLAWWHGDGRSTAILLLDPAEAAKVVSDDLRNRIDREKMTAGPEALVWSGPRGDEWFSTRDGDTRFESDEILRHVSRFGDWTLSRGYPVRIETRHRTPVMAGAFAIAAILLGGGVVAGVTQRKAIRITEERVSFVNRVSHELRTPLTNLLLNTDLALDATAVQDRRVRRRLGLIREETSRLSRIVDNVLAFARLERGRHAPRIAACDVTRVVADLRDSFAPLFERKSIRCEFENTLTAEVATDRDALAQILSNLLSNIEKYAGEGARARVKLELDVEGLVIDVQDDGPGIPAASRQRVFQPFERAGSRVDEGVTGTGLGLAISREFAERLGGRLDLVPAAKGACFRLIIPVPPS